MDVDTEVHIQGANSFKRKLHHFPLDGMKKKQHSTSEGLESESNLQADENRQKTESIGKSPVSVDTHGKDSELLSKTRDTPLRGSKVTFSEVEYAGTKPHVNYQNAKVGSNTNKTNKTVTNIVGILKNPGNIGKRLSTRGYFKQLASSNPTEPLGSRPVATKILSKDFSLYTRASSESVSNVLKSRGVNMMEQKRKLVTPVKVEFNSLLDSTDFNVLEQTQTLFDLLSDKDRQIRILDVNKQVVLFERGISLPEGEDFSTLMKTRHQTFRKGNHKVTIFFVVESTLSIQKLKYMDPIKTFIFENNIWVKPDFFDTKIESSPGYFTLLHPKITNKMDYKEILKQAMYKISIDINDEAVKTWYESNGVEINETEINIPTFQLEPGVKKWGKIQTEVLRVTCSAEDANYVKYLLSKVGDMDQLDQGLFVPEGLHLMAGKEVVSQILTEQKNFLGKISSIQLEGISLEDMSTFCEVRKNTLKDYFLDIPGVLSVERTFFTDTRGQWLLVIDHTQSDNVKKYFEEQLTTIYKAKRDCKIRLLTYQVPNANKAYRLQILQDVIGKVGSYAEALTKRFSSTGKNVGPVQKSMIQKQKTNVGYTDFPTEHDAQDFPPLGIVPNNHTTKPDATYTEQKQTIADKLTNTQDINHTSTSTNKKNFVIEADKSADITKSAQAPKYQDLADTITTLREENKKHLEAITTVLEQKIDQVIESRMIELSNTVATTVAAQLLKTMRGLASSHKAKSCTQDSQFLTPPRIDPGKLTEDSVNITQSAEKQRPMQMPSNARTQDMLSELDKIGRQTNSITDPPHDIKKLRNKGSTDET